MSPEESGVEAAASRMAWQMHLGWSATRVYTWWRDEYPLTSTSFLDRALALAEELQAVTERFRTLEPGQSILEAFDRPLPLDRLIGVRFAVEFPGPESQRQFRTYGANILPDTTLEEAEALIAKQVEIDLKDKYKGVVLRYSDTGRPVMTPINVTLGPLPSRI